MMLVMMSGNEQALGRGGSISLKRFFASFNTVCSLCLAAAVIAGCRASASEKDATRQFLIDLEKQSWQAWKDHDAPFFQNFLADDHVEILSRGPVNKEAVVRSVGGKVCAVEEYSVDQFTVNLIGDDTAIVTYHAAQKTTCNGAEVPSPVWATSIYAQRDKRWVNVLYEQTAAAK
jgi:hypothetical protein